MPNAGLPRRVTSGSSTSRRPSISVCSRGHVQARGARRRRCCGTTPEHIRRIAASARMAGAAPTESESALSGDSSYFPAAARPTCASFRSRRRGRLCRQARRRQVRRVGRSQSSHRARYHKALAAAKMLTSSGADVINIADGGARASAHVQPPPSPGDAARARHRNDPSTCAGATAISSVRWRTSWERTRSGSKISSSSPAIRPSSAIFFFPRRHRRLRSRSIGILKTGFRLDRGLDPGGKPLGAPTSSFAPPAPSRPALNYDRECGASSSNCGGASSS